MRLPRATSNLSGWPDAVAQDWDSLLDRARRLETDAGRSDRFARMLEALRQMVRRGSFQGLGEILSARVTARALTWLWLNDQDVGRKLISVKMLDALVESQQPRLTRVTTLQLLQLYFREFDQLDGLNGPRSVGFRAALERHLVAQLALFPKQQSAGLHADALTLLRKDGDRLFSIHGPSGLAHRVRRARRELGEAFRALGLSGLDAGRYGDVCRAHFYLETLRGLSPDQWDPILDELLKPSISKAPFEGGRRIGHAALEILIDKAGDTPGERWQDFVLSLAGDPRIGSGSPNFVEWWRPLGEERIERVRSWLSKEDLRLFLQAVEEYGKQTNNAALKRMFPARKVFLEGLHKLGMVRSTRLMLGALAEASVRRILGKEVRTSFARLEDMSDKALIYLDCGDFHLIEGSHSFKIWTYLARPSPEVASYDRLSFSHYDLTKKFPKQYAKANPDTQHLAVPHQGMWQRRVFEFLAENGIRLDIEELLTKQDYRAYLQNFGMPVIRKAKGRPARKAEKPSAAAVSDAPLAKKIDALSRMEMSILRYLKDHPGDKVRYVSNILQIAQREVNRLLHGPLKEFCTQDADYGWSLKPKVKVLLDRIWPDK